MSHLLHCYITSHRTVYRIICVIACVIVCVLVCECLHAFLCVCVCVCVCLYTYIHVFIDAVSRTTLEFTIMQLRLGHYYENKFKCLLRLICLIICLIIWQSSVNFASLLAFCRMCLFFSFRSRVFHFRKNHFKRCCVTVGNQCIYYCIIRNNNYCINNNKLSLSICMCFRAPYSY